MTRQSAIHILNIVKSVGVTERRTRHRASLKRQILDAASRLFVEEGYDRVTMRRIAGRIEYSPTTIYLHFKGKSELFNAVCEETFSQFTEKLERLKSLRMAPLGYLREALRLYIDFGVRHPEHYTITFLQGPKPGQASSFEASIGGRAFDTLRLAVRACVDSGDIRTTSTDMTAQVLWAAVHGVTALLITDKSFPFASHGVLGDHTVDLLISGLRAPSLPGRTSAVLPRSNSTFID